MTIERVLYNPCAVFFPAMDIPPSPRDVTHFSVRNSLFTPSWERRATRRGDSHSGTQCIHRPCFPRNAATHFMPIGVNTGLPLAAEEGNRNDAKVGRGTEAIHR